LGWSLRDGEIAGLLFGMVLAQPIKARLALRATRSAPLQPRRCGRRFDRRDGQPVGQEGQIAAALQAGRVLEQQRIGALAAMK
jgi:hypothetical protein